MFKVSKKIPVLEIQIYIFRFQQIQKVRIISERYIFGETIRSVFRTQSNIYDEAFQRKLSTVQILDCVNSLTSEYIEIHRSFLLVVVNILDSYERFHEEVSEVQKQPPDVFYKKRCSQKFRNIHKKTPVSESLFKRVAGLRPAVLY